MGYGENLCIPYRKKNPLRNLILSISVINSATENHLYPADIQAVYTSACHCYLITLQRSTPFCTEIKKEILIQSIPFSLEALSNMNIHNTPTVKLFYILA